MTREELIQACRQWVIACTGLDGSVVYVAHQTTAPPARPCISVQLITPGARKGHDGGQVTITAGGASGTMTRTILGQRVATVRFSAYGAGGYDLLEKMRAAEARYDLQETAETLLISPRLDDPQEVPSPREDGTFEPRFIASAAVGYVATSVEDVTPVDTATGSGEAGDDFVFNTTHDLT